MSTITFDTMELVEELRSAGMPQAQAEAIVRTIVKSHTELATRHDIERLELKMEAKFLLLQWMMGGIIALSIANFAKQYF